MKPTALFIIILFKLIAFNADAQTFSITGKINTIETGEKITSATVTLENTEHVALTDEHGNYQIKNIPPGKYILVVSSVGYKEAQKEITLSNKNITINIRLYPSVLKIDSVIVHAEKEKTFGITRLKNVEGTAIYAGKKSEVIVMSDINANTAANNSRQIYSKIAGLNIWENDGAGIQLGIGGRGLNPNRVSNFNTRQNGYDMSADALGYPESYYSPPAEATDRIEIVRGAASLQYGTQFGGMVNFKLKEAPGDKKIELVSRETLGSWGFFNTFNSLGGTIKKFSYYVFYQNKSGDGWRPNSHFDVNTAYATTTYKVNNKLSVTLQYTHMDYLAHQPGGLTDQEFNQDPGQSVRDRNWFQVHWNLGAALINYKISDNLKFDSRFFGLMADRSALGILTYINQPDPGGPRGLLTDHYRNWGNESRMLYNYTIKKSTHTLLLGFRYYSGNTDRQQGSGNDESGGNKSDFIFNSGTPDYSKYNFPNRNISLFTENIFHVTQKLSIIPGVRLENIVTEANGFYNIVNTDLAGNIIYRQAINDYKSSVRSFILGGIGISYYQNNALQFYGNISQNYRAINFNDIRTVNPNLRVDSNLQDEKGYSADMGVRGNIESIFNYDLSFFMINYDNRIGTVQKVDDATYNIYNFRTNVSQSRNLGMESFAEVDIWKLIKKENAKMKIAVFSNLALIDARYINSKQTAYENRKVELAPDLIFKTGLSFKRGRFSFAYQVSYTSEQFSDGTNAVFSPRAISGLIPAYYVMDFSGEYRINKFFTVYGTINNLTDNRYFTRRADSYPGPGIIPADARSFSFTLQVKI